MEISRWGSMSVSLAAALALGGCVTTALLVDEMQNRRAGREVALQHAATVRQDVTLAQPLAEAAYSVAEATQRCARYGVRRFLDCTSLSTPVPGREIEDPGLREAVRDAWRAFEVRSAFGLACHQRHFDEEFCEDTVSIAIEDASRRWEDGADHDPQAQAWAASQPTR